MANTPTNSFREEALLFYLDDKYGSAPYNIFKTLRMQKGYSLQQMATSLGISKNALVRLENGTYANPLEAALNYWTKRGHAYPELVEGYSDFQYLTRKRAYKYFGPSLKVNVARGSTHPLRQLRQYRISPADCQFLPVGIEQVSRDLCLPVDTLRHFEKKFRRQQSVPKALKAVLNFIGYSPSEIKRFENAYRSWRMNNIRVETANLLDKGLLSRDDAQRIIA